MRKSSLLLLVLLMTSGCAWRTRPSEPCTPPPLLKPPQLPELIRLPEAVTGPNFVDRLGLLTKPSEQKK